MLPPWSELSTLEEKYSIPHHWCFPALIISTNTFALLHSHLGLIASDTENVTEEETKKQEKYLSKHHTEFIFRKAKEGHRRVIWNFFTCKTETEIDDLSSLIY